MPEMWKALQDGKPLTLQDLKPVSKELLQLTSERVWLVDGEMGAGKTTLIKALCESLGVKDGMTSPTFSIVNQYETQTKEIIYHFDFYRLKNEREALDIGVEEYLESGSYCFLEWSEKISHLIPSNNFKIKIHQRTPETRIVEYFSHD